MGDFSVEINRTDASLDKAKIWRLESGNILETSPCLGRKFFTGQGLWGSDQMNYTCEQGDDGGSVDLLGSLQ